MTVAVRYLNLPNAPNVYDQDYFQGVLRQLNQFSYRIMQPAGNGWIVPTTYTPLRTFTNSASVTLADLANVVATMMGDMLAVGRLGGPSS